MAFKGLVGRVRGRLKRFECQDGDGEESLAALSIVVLLALYSALIIVCLACSSVLGCDMREKEAIPLTIVDLPGSADFAAEWWSMTVHDSEGRPYLIVGYGDNFSICQVPH